MYAIDSSENKIDLLNSNDLTLKKTIKHKFRYLYCKADSRKEDIKYFGFRDGVSEFNIGTLKMGKHYESKHWVYEIYYDQRRDIMFLGEQNGVLEVISCADFKQISSLELE